jgi:hypothetical protein
VCSIARRWLLDSLSKIGDFTARAKNKIDRELAHRTRWTTSTTRTDNPTTLLSFDYTPLPPALSSTFQEVRMDIPTSSTAVGMLYQLASHMRELRSGDPVPSRAAANPPAQDIL